ncbi:hypothetical protein [Brevundimonas vesicularis]|uniref:hypothetical protein n=1 Tax=Brevundimonas vesicularis TaxID=41276 RepID=UPI0022AC0CE5|nr:hypothetical protein [Brevundimonas vesicularis]
MSVEINNLVEMLSKLSSMDSISQSDVGNFQDAIDAFFKSGHDLEVLEKMLDLSVDMNYFTSDESALSSEPSLFGLVELKRRVNEVLSLYAGK